MFVTIIADASFCPDLKVAGYGFWAISNRGKLRGGGAIKTDVLTNVTAECFAVCNALHEAILAGVVIEGDTVLLQTDCVGAIDALNHKRNTLNEQERSALIYKDKIAQSFKLKIRFKHVKGHSKNQAARFKSNNICDFHAKQGLRIARQNKRSLR